MSRAAIDPDSGEEHESWRDDVRRLARQRDAVVLAHNYQSAEIQDVADHVGDSLALSRIAARTAGSISPGSGVNIARSSPRSAPIRSTIDAAPGPTLPDAALMTTDSRRGAGEFTGLGSIRPQRSAATVVRRSSHVTTGHGKIARNFSTN